jgi:hypothetical protein
VASIGSIEAANEHQLQRWLRRKRVLRRHKKKA